MQATFENSTSREFDLEERTEKFRVSDSDGENLFWIKATPIESIASVNVNGSGVDFLELEGSVELTSPAVKGDLVEVTYTGGLIDQTVESTFLATVPEDLNIAAIRQISFEYQNRDKIAVPSIALDGNTTTIPTLKLLTYTENILKKYKNWGAGF